VKTGLNIAHYTFETGAHGLVNTDASVTGVDGSTLGTGDEVECTLVGVGDGVGTTDWIVVGGTDAVAADTAPVDTMFTTSSALHFITRVCNNIVYQCCRLLHYTYHYDQS